MHRIANFFLLFISLSCFAADKPPIKWTAAETPILQQIKQLRSMPDDVRARTTKQLAIDIRGLPDSPNKLRLADALASLSTEGDFGHDTLQEVANTLSATLQKQPAPQEKDGPAYPYISLAQLVRYEHVASSLQDPQYAAAMAQLEAVDQRRQQADFTLIDLAGNSWTLKSLKGKVVLVNFWATWCPPCNRELPDLEALYSKYKNQGLVVLAITDEEVDKVSPFIAKRKLSFPILLDAGREVNKTFAVDGLPKSFVYDREGKLVAQAIDMRTAEQFQEMLRQAGLK